MKQMIFLDTEFTSFESPNLVSIGLVTGESTFYAEVAYQLENCSEFVIENVLPLLSPEASLRSAETLKCELSDWLASIREGEKKLVVCFDFEVDWMLFCSALGDLPTWCHPERVRSMDVNKLKRLDFHRTNKLPEHHALNDAMAFQHSFRFKSLS